MLVETLAGSNEWAVLYSL